jgi:hypothetical protein
VGRDEGLPVGLLRAVDVDLDEAVVRGAFVGVDQGFRSVVRDVLKKRRDFEDLARKHRRYKNVRFLKISFLFSLLARLRAPTPKRSEIVSSYPKISIQSGK